MRLLGNLDDGLEVAQIAFVKAYEALGQLEKPSQFGAWLMKIVVNHSLNYRRKRSRYKALALDEGPSSDGSDRPRLLDQVVSREPSALDRLAGQELAEQMQAAIDELPEKLRAPLILFAVEKLPQKEIAETLGCSLQTVKWSVFEARRRLRKRLAKLMP